MHFKGWLLEIKGTLVRMQAGLENINIAWMAVSPNRCMKSTCPSHNHSCLFLSFHQKKKKNKMYKLIEKCNWSRHVRDCKTNQIICSKKKMLFQSPKDQYEKEYMSFRDPVTLKHLELFWWMLCHHDLPEVSQGPRKGSHSVYTLFCVSLLKLYIYLLKIGWWIYPDREIELPET